MLAESVQRMAGQVLIVCVYQSRLGQKAGWTCAETTGKVDHPTSVDCVGDFLSTRNRRLTTNACLAWRRLIDSSRGSLND